MDRTVKKNFIIDVIFSVIVISLIIMVSFAVIKYLYPFVIGVIIAFAVQKPAHLLSKRFRLKNGNMAAALSVAVYLIVGVIFAFLVYGLARFLINFSEYLPILFEKVNSVFSDIEKKYSYVFKFIYDNFDISTEELIGNSAERFMDLFGVWVSNFAKGTIKNVPSIFISSIVTLVATCYISRDFRGLKRFVKSLIGKELIIKIIKVKEILIGSVFKLLKGYLILTFIVFVILFFGLLVLRFENAFVFALIIAFADMLPLIGTGIIMIPWAVISVLTGNIYYGIGLGILYVIVVVARNFLEPKIIGNQIGVNSLFTLVAMFLGLKLLGVAGLVLFPIIFIVIVKYYKNEMGLSQ